MKQPVIEKRHRDEEGIIGAEYGNMTVWTLRKSYGANFAPNEDENANLCDILERLDEVSLAQLITDLPPNKR